MKKRLQLLITTLLIIGAVNVYSQNRCTIGDEHRSVTVEVPANTIVKNTGDKIITTHSTRLDNKVIRANAETHMLSIKPNGNWDMIQISGPDGYSAEAYQWDGDGFEEQVEEGIYHIFLAMYGEYTSYLSYEVNVDQDIYMIPTADEACYTVHANALDEYGEPIKNHTIIDNFPELYLSYGFGNASWFFMCGEEFPEEWPVRFNQLTNACSISLTQRVSVDNQTTYFINYPLHVGQFNSDLEITNDPSEMKTYLAQFNMHKQTRVVYYVDYFRYYVSESDGFNIPLCQYGWCDGNLFDPAEPIRLITNNKVDDPTTFYDNGYSAVKPFVTAFEELDPNSYSEYYDKVAANAVFYTNNQWVNEPIDAMPFVWNGKALEYFDPLTSSPAARYTDIGQTCYFGERTPILYWQAENFNSSASFWGDTYLAGPMEFIGDNGCIRKGDECAIITVNAGGEEIFNDSVYKFNQNYNMPVSEPSTVAMEITDNHLVDDEIVKANHTTINFDLNREDAMPPTMTILQVMDENGREKVYLPNYTNSQINFAAGDFAPHVYVIGWYDKMQYVGKPSIEVYYSTESKDWTTLNYTEDETMFHVNYGNFFTIDLSQLDGSVANTWVNLKFILTDEAGNSQTQELSNVFFAGEMTSVNEISANSLIHSVYPNPFSGNVTINAAEPVNGVATFTIYNTIGEMVYHSTMNCNETTEFRWNAADNANGVYLYQISTEKGMIQGRVVKE